MGWDWVGIGLDLRVGGGIEYLTVLINSKNAGIHSCPENGNK